jgi:hypothetical protein
MELKDYDCELEHDVLERGGPKPYRHTDDLSIKCSVLSMVVGRAESHTDKTIQYYTPLRREAVFVWCLLGAARV